METLMELANHEIIAPKVAKAFSNANELLKEEMKKIILE
jgi:hypothetical protein